MLGKQFKNTSDKEGRLNRQKTISKFFSKDYVPNFYKYKWHAAVCLFLVISEANRGFSIIKYMALIFMS